MNEKLKNLWFNSMELQRKIAKLITTFIPYSKLRQKARRSLIAKSRKLYLSQYLYALKKNNNLSNKNKILKQNNKIWICWFQGEENAPDIVKACIKSIKKYKPKNMEVIVIDENNLKEYTSIPEYIYEKLEKNYMTKTHFSDIVRACLLEKHGGLWIDSTVLLTAPIPEEILKSKRFAMTENDHLTNSWFLSFKENDEIIKKIKILLFEYWKHENKLLNYFLYHLFFDVIIENNKKLKKEWEKVPKFYDYNCYDLGDIFLLQPYSEKIFNNILKKTSIHKLKYKYDKTKHTKETFLEKILTL